MLQLSEWSPAIIMTWSIPYCRNTIQETHQFCYFEGDPKWILISILIPSFGDKTFLAAYPRIVHFNRASRDSNGLSSPENQIKTKKEAKIYSSLNLSQSSGGQITTRDCWMRIKSEK